MKKIIAILMVALMTVTMVACAKNEENISSEPSG